MPKTDLIETPLLSEDSTVNLTDLSRKDQLIIQAALTELLYRTQSDQTQGVSDDTNSLLCDLERLNKFDSSDLENLLDKVDALVAGGNIPA